MTQLMGTLFKPMGIIAGLLAGLVAKKVFEKTWMMIDDQEPPDAEHREVEWPKMVIALVLEGAIFTLTRGLVDHAARVGFSRYTGVWPGQERPERE